MEKVQAENIALKKAPGLVSQEQLSLLKKDNEGLKVLKLFLVAFCYSPLGKLKILIFFYDSQQLIG